MPECYYNHAQELMAVELIGHRDEPTITVLLNGHSIKQFSNQYLPTLRFVQL